MLPSGELIGKHPAEAVPFPKEFVCPIPFSGVFLGALLLNRQAVDYSPKSLQEAVAREIDGNPRYSLSWLAVQEQRKVDNPAHKIDPTASISVFLPPTAFEGYLYGLPPEQIVTTLAEMGADALDVCARLHSSNPGFTSRLMQTLIDGQLKKGKDTALLEEADTLLGALLARLRMVLLSHDGARRYRDTTHSAVARVLPKFTCVVDDSLRLFDSYFLPYVNREPGATHPLQFTWDSLNNRQKNGWQLLTYLGKVGHPLFRAVRSSLFESGSARRYLSFDSD